MPNFKYFRDHIIANEMDVKHPYLDTKGYITVGPGLKVEGRNAQETADNFTRLPWQVTDNGNTRPATEAEIKAGLDALHAEQRQGAGNRGADAYNKTTDLTLPDADRARLLDGEIETRIGKIKGEVGADAWDKLTDGQKAAVLDIHYATGSLESFPNLQKALKDGDAKKMAEEAGFMSGRNPDRTPIRNWEREARNQAAILGVSQEEGRRAVLDKYQGKEKPDFGGEKVAPPKGKTSDATDGMENTGQPKVTLHETNFGTVLSTTNVAALETTDSPAQTSDLLEAASATQTGGLANEAAETQAAADMVRGEDAKEQTANIDSRIASMREMAAQPIDHPGKSALLKPVGVWTESEMKDVLNSAQSDFTGWKSGDPLKARMYETVQDWHTNTYGDGEQLVEGGKPVQPLPLGITPINPSPHTTPQGEDLWKASSRMGEKIGTIAETDGYEQSVKGLQRGLNILNSTQPLPDRSEAWGPYTPQEALKVDGEYGPKTDFALKDTLARHGMPKADDALALGRFGNFADQVKQSGKAEGLDQAARDIFGPLYGGSEAPNGVLQETLNKVGGSSIENWQDLKVDDWIGPKTTEFFAQVMDNTDPEDFTRSFGQGLGLL